MRFVKPMPLLVMISFLAVILSNAQATPYIHYNGTGSLYSTDADGDNPWGWTWNDDILNFTMDLWIELPSSANDVASSPQVGSWEALSAQAKVTANGSTFEFGPWADVFLDAISIGQLFFTVHGDLSAHELYLTVEPTVFNDPFVNDAPARLLDVNPDLRVYMNIGSLEPAGYDVIDLRVVGLENIDESPRVPDRGPTLLGLAMGLSALALFARRVLGLRRTPAA